MRQLLFYQNIVALDKVRHQSLELVDKFNLDFAKSINFIPILHTELTKVAQELPIVFLKSGDTEFALAAVVGLRDKENLQIKDGNWVGRYIPAFIRRYPFITLSQPDNPAQFFIAIDEEANCLIDSKNKKKAGQGSEPLFEGEAPSKKIQQVLPFLQKYHLEHRNTIHFCKQLSDLQLLSSSNLKIQSKSGQTYQVNGVWIIEEANLKKLSPDVLHQLLSDGVLSKIIEHQFSLNHFTGLTEKGNELHSHSNIAKSLKLKGVDKKIPTELVSSSSRASVAKKNVKSKVVRKSAKVLVEAKKTPIKKTKIAAKTPAKSSAKKTSR